MKIRSIITIFLAVFTVFAFAGCGSSAGDDYVGSWYDENSQRTVMTIDEADGGSYHTQVIQIVDNETEYIWTMDCTVKNQKLVYDNCTKTYHSVKDGNDKKTREYTDGSGSFLLEDDTLTWTDKKEDTGEGMDFVVFGEDFTSAS